MKTAISVSKQSDEIITILMGNKISLKLLRFPYLNICVDLTKFNIFY